MAILAKSAHDTLLIAKLNYVLGSLYIIGKIFCDLPPCYKTAKHHYKVFRHIYSNALNDKMNLHGLKKISE
jgi:hypothetical protein